MKVRCTKEVASAALQMRAAVVPSRSPKPVLTNVKLEATKGSAVLLRDRFGSRHPHRSRGRGSLRSLRGAFAEWPADGHRPGRAPAGTVFDIHSDGTAAIVKENT